MAVLELFAIGLALLFVSLLATVGYVLYCQGEWERRGIYTVQIGAKFLGHFSQMILKTKAFPYVIQDIYNDIKQNKHKVGGIYQFARMQLTLADPDIVREVTVKHFDHFTDRRPFIEAGVDKMLGRSILNLKGDEWRDIRHQLSPAFTGSKLRGMMELMESTCQQLTKSLAQRKCKEEPVDMNEVLRRFAADVISTTAFGTVADSLVNPDAPFYNNGIKLMDTSGLRALVFAGYLMSPKFMSYLKVPFVPQALSDFFMGTILSTIHFRQTQNKTRADMIQLLLDARTAIEKQGHKRAEITDTDIVAQAFTFFLGGFDTIATALNFSTQLLAQHPDIQERVREEVDAAFERGNGKITYEDIHDLKYMDMFISEVLRMFPPAVMIDRQCTKPFELPEHGIKLAVGESVNVPIIGLHYDPDYFPDPDRFDPERFSDENKDKIKPFTYLPFGVGPRNCIGMRFAQIEVKLCLAHLLATNKLEVSAKTQLPIKISAESTAIRMEGGFWLNIIPRENPSVQTNE